MKRFFIYSFIGIICFVIFYLCFGIIKMPADDMKNSIRKGDILIYRKFLLSPNHNDITVYRADYDENDDTTTTRAYYFIQRVIGLPGDSILIDSNKVYINHISEKTLHSFQKNYIIQLTDSIEKFKHIDSLISERAMISKKYEYAGSLAENAYYKLKRDTNVTGISYELDNPFIYEDIIYPYNESIKWNKHFFGYLYLPKKNDKMILTKNNLNIYSPVIQKEEKSSDIENDTLIINQKKITEYPFKDDYYFVMGDNRDNAIDSRYLGPIAKKHLIGIVFYHFHSK